MEPAVAITARVTRMCVGASREPGQAKIHEFRESEPICEIRLNRVPREFQTVLCVLCVFVFVLMVSSNCR